MDYSKNGFRSGRTFNETERHEIIKEYLNGTQTKTEIWKKHTGQQQEHGTILKWMRQLGYIVEEFSIEKERKRAINYPYLSMSDDKITPSKSPEELQQEILQLQKQLEVTQLKAEGYELMIEIAEKELNLPIRKKSNTK
jgi:transposase